VRDYMKKIISFEKEIAFSSMIGEVTSIALDHTLKFTDSSSVKGNFVISGTYKMTEASTLEEKFSYEIPTEIDLSERLDLETCKISIDDFTYEVVNEDTLKCNIDVLVEGVEEVVLEEDDVEVLDDDERECDGDKKEDKEIEIPIKEDIKDLNTDVEREEVDDDKSVEEVVTINKIDEKVKEEKEANDNNSSDIGSLFASLDSAEETFTTYSVYIFRREDTLDKVLDKYKITREELCEYNDLDNLEIGSKLIIPSTNE
jgi:LysM domain protein